MIDVVNTCHRFCPFFADAAGSRNSRSRGGGATKSSGSKAQTAKKNTNEVTSENNSRSSSVFGNGNGNAGGRKFQVRGRNFSGDSSELYPFNLDGPPAYGEVVPEPAFVTPIIGNLPHYSKRQNFVQKFNFDKTPTFSRVFHPNFFDKFSREIKVVNS